MRGPVVCVLALALCFTGVVGGLAEATRSQPDLIVSAVSAPPSASPGATVVVSSTVKNQGKASSKAFSVAYYLATSPSNLTGAPLLGAQSVSSLAAGASVALVNSFTVPGSTTIGTFYVVAVADSTKVISESNESNNTGSSGAITIQSIAPTSTTPAIEYYVSPTGNDTADGSVAHPWATIQHAADTVGPGTVVHVAPGNYPQAITSNTSGTATARIRFVSDTRWGAKIISTGAQYIWENHGDYLDIQGFDITGDGRIGILNWASNVRIIGNHVHDIPVMGCTADGGAGIDHANYSAQDNDTIANLVHDIAFSSACSGAHGIYHSNLRGTIQNNIVYRIGGYGIHLWHAANVVTIANNLVMRTGQGGVLIGAGDAPGGITIDNCTVSNNIVVHNRVFDGIHSSVGIRQYGSVGMNNRYLNNLLFDNDVNFMNQSTIGGIPNMGTVLASPNFVNDQPDGTGDYHLNTGSPAIDTGTGDGAPLDDFDSGSRPQGIGWDIGPYEWRP